MPGRRPWSSSSYRSCRRRWWTAATARRWRRATARPRRPDGVAERSISPPLAAASGTAPPRATRLPWRTSSAMATHYPVKVSENRRYLTDQQGTPLFWLGTTQWELFRGYTVEDARTILESARDKGFAFVQVMLMGVGDG